MKKHHRRFLELRMLYQQQHFLNAKPSQRSPHRVDSVQRQLRPRLFDLELNFHFFLGPESS